MFAREYKGLKVCAIGNAIYEVTVSPEKNQVSRDRGFSGKAVYVTPVQSHFRLSGWPASDKPIGKQTFRQYRSGAHFSAFSSSQTSQLSLYHREKSQNDLAVSPVLLITSGFFNWIWSSATLLKLTPILLVNLPFVLISPAIRHFI